MTGNALACGRASRGDDRGRDYKSKYWSTTSKGMRRPGIQAHFQAVLAMVLPPLHIQHHLSQDGEWETILGNWIEVSRRL